MGLVQGYDTANIPSFLQKERKAYIEHGTCRAFVYEGATQINNRQRPGLERPDVLFLCKVGFVPFVSFLYFPQLRHLSFSSYF